MQPGFLDFTPKILDIAFLEVHQSAVEEIRADSNHENNIKRERLLEQKPPLRIRQPQTTRRTEVNRTMTPESEIT